MQKGSLLLFLASLGIAWVPASTTSTGYCCPQITVALGTEDDGTYNFLAEGSGPAMEKCQNACIYSKNSNITDLYCFQAVTSEELGNGQVQCEAISSYSVLKSTTPSVTGPTTEDLLKKIEDLQKELARQTKKTGDLEKDFYSTLASAKSDISNINKDLAGQTKKTEDLEKEVNVRKAEVSKIKAEVISMDGRLNKTEEKTSVCGYQASMKIDNATTLNFDRVHVEVDFSGGRLDSDGSFTAGVTGTYLVTLGTLVMLEDNELLSGWLRTTSGKYDSERFIYSRNYRGGSGYKVDQPSASRYVKLAAGETLHIILFPSGGTVGLSHAIMCVSLYSASG